VYHSEVSRFLQIITHRNLSRLHRSSDLTKLILIQQDSKKPFNQIWGPKTRKQGVRKRDRKTRKQGGPKKPLFFTPRKRPKSWINKRVQKSGFLTGLGDFLKHVKFWWILRVSTSAILEGGPEGGSEMCQSVFFFWACFRPPCFFDPPNQTPQVLVEGFFGVLLNEDQLG
jgi:hypothetical protein